VYLFQRASLLIAGTSTASVYPDYDVLSIALFNFQLLGTDTPLSLPRRCHPLVHKSSKLVIFLPSKRRMLVRSLDGGVSYRPKQPYNSS
jgi:hypothetical protein